MSYTLEEEEKINKALLQLSPKEMAELKSATDSSLAGGAPLTGSVRNKAASLKLAYLSTGRLRPVIYAMVRPEPTIGKRQPRR